MDPTIVRGVEANWPRWDAALLDTTTWGLLARAVADRPDAVAVRDFDEAVTFRQLADRADRAASRLRDRGVVQGTRVLLATGGTIDWIVLVYALTRAGAVIVPLNITFAPGEIRQVLDRARPAVVLAESRAGKIDIAEKLRRVSPALVDGATSVDGMPWITAVAVLDVEDPSPSARAEVFGVDSDPGLGNVDAPDVGPEDDAFIVFTSGSTAFPKGARCSHRAFLGAGQGLACGWDLDGSDLVLSPLPPFHTAGILGSLYSAHARGAGVALIGMFDPSRALDAIERFGCTAAFCFDTVFTKLMADPGYSPDRVATLTKIVSGATPAYLQSLRQRWPVVYAAGVYGSTESASLLTVTVPDESRQDFVASNGFALPGSEIVIVDPDTGRRLGADEMGELCFRGWTRFSGYIDEADEVGAIDGDGFFHSGDMAFVDADGRLYYRGRYKQMIKTGGENVSPREVEIGVESAVPEVEMCQVVGAADETWGEAVVAFVQMAADRDDAAMRDLCREAMAGYKIPKRFVRVRPHEWPTMFNGRPDKTALRVIAEGRRALAP